jgi:hypothetical protein
LPTCGTGPPGWESIPGLITKFTITGSVGTTFGEELAYTCGTGPPGWESIRGLLKRFTNTGSVGTTFSKELAYLSKGCLTMISLWLLAFCIISISCHLVATVFFEGFFMYDIQHCFICRPSDSTVSKDAGIEAKDSCD